MLALLVGPTSRAHTTSEQNIVRRAKVGYGPCCSRATHAAIPPSYASGDYRSMETRGLAASKIFGPWAPPRIAASHYVKSPGACSSSWDLSAASLPMSPLETLSLPPPAGDDLHLHVPAAKPAPPSPTADITTGIASFPGDETSPTVPFPSPSDSGPVILSLGLATTTGSWNRLTGANTSL